ncbi:MAG: type II toxin-antitoxin system RelE/ParE family toxin [Planctomycetota bacterium]
MSGRKFRILPAADAEYDEQLRWLDERDVAVARKFAGRIEDALNEIREYPTRYPLHLGAFRSRLVFGFRTHIVYVVTDYEILVVAIAHTSRRPGYWRDRVDDRGY